MDGLWSLLKRGISGVSTKHLQDYVDECVFRYKNRGSDMFRALLARAVEKASA